MKNKFILTTAAIALSAACGFGAATYNNGLLSVPADFHSDFNENGLEGWATVGNGEDPSDKYSDMFSADNAFVLGKSGEENVAWSCSEFKNGTQSDEWLISPEFTVTADKQMVYYTVMATGTNLNCKYKVMISEGGINKEDFKVIATNTVQGKTNAEGYVMRRHVIEGYSGKKVRLAFVNTGNSVGLLGFTDMGVGPYYLNVEHSNSYGNWIITDPESPEPITVRLTTSVKCTGFTATLTAGDFTTSYTSSKICNLTTMLTDSFVFDDKFNFSGTREFKITIKPNYEGAETSELTGTIIVAEPRYQRVVLLEEFTSVKCKFCPRGIAFMNYFLDKYDGKDGNGKAIVAAIHSPNMGKDPMVITDNDYYTDAQDIFSRVATESVANALPGAMYNRVGGEDPAKLPIDDLMARKAIAKTRIKEVDYDAAKGKHVKVDFTVETAFTAEDAGLNASVIVIENNLRDTSNSWNQLNAYATATTQQIVNLYGEKMVPYFDLFVDTSDPITGLTFNEVARGTYPSAEGMPLEESFIDGTEREFSIEFDMPSSIKNPENISLILVISSHASGEVLTADIKSAREFSGSYDSVNNVGECTENEEEWMTLDGISLTSRPTKHGIYIIRQGTKLKKVVQ